MLRIKEINHPKKPLILLLSADPRTHLPTCEEKGLPMKLRDAVDQFHRGYFATHRRSPRTQKAYAIDLKQFLAYVGETRPLTSLRPEDLENWAAELKTRNYASASIRRKFASLRVFFGYWERREVLDRSPLRHIRLDLAPSRKLVRALTEEEIRNLLRQARCEHEEQRACRNSEPVAADPWFLSLRNLTVIEVLFATGIRVGELVALTLDHYQPTETALLINGKGARQRLAFLSDSRSRKTFERYRLARQRIRVDGKALFLNTWGNSLSTQGVSRIVATTAHRARINRRITPHMLRHTVARLLLSNGANIRVVQEFLGHASITTTEKYTSVTKDHLVRALRSHHPNHSMG